MQSSVNRRFRSLPASWQGWLVCGSVLLLTAARSGITYSFGCFIVRLRESGEETALAVQDWIGTLSFTVSLSLSPVTVACIRILGQNGFAAAAASGVVILSCSCFMSSLVATVANEAWLFLTHSLLYGFGSSLTYMSSSLAIAEHFSVGHRHHVMATSVLLCGYPLGSLIFNPINGWLVADYGVVPAFRVSALLLLLVGLPCSLLLIGTASEAAEVSGSSVSVGMINSSSTRSTRRQLLVSCCRLEVPLWLTGNLLSYIGFYIPFVNLAYYMERRHIELSQSKWAVTLLSLAELVTYVTASAVGDFLKGRLVFVNAFAALGLSVLYFLWPCMDTSYESIMAISAALGGLLGLTIVFQFAGSVEVTGLPTDVAWSATNFCSGLGILSSPIFSGCVFDLRDSYDDVWRVCGCLYLAQFVTFGSVPLLWRRRHGTCSPDAYAALAEEAETSPQAV